MGTTTYKSILRDQISGNGITPLYGWGQMYEAGHVTRDRFIGVLGRQQDYFRNVVGKTLAGDMFGGRKGAIEETDGIGYQQFEHLDQILSRGDWREDPILVEQFMMEVDRLRRDEYERPEWLDKLFSETAPK